MNSLPTIRDAYIRIDGGSPTCRSFWGADGDGGVERMLLPDPSLRESDVDFRVRVPHAEWGFRISGAGGGLVCYRKLSEWGHDGDVQVIEASA